MERPLDQDLAQIRESLLEMGGLVEQMIATATRALVDRDREAAKEVIVVDRAVDRLEKEIDEACHSVLVRRQPAAVDLRLLIAVMKITADLERMGDSAVNIAQATISLNEEPLLKPYVDLPKMSQKVQEMVRSSLDAFVRRDAELALTVCRGDDEIDTLYRRLFDELMEMMVADRNAVRRAVHLLLIARNLERIADHATNIGEDVIYYVEGFDIRHRAGEEQAKS
ncbi:MAG TPA: phosphate signaling complex protein PhoU [Thermoanaerobaculia bacterium]|nr:phosphate signaling complex protein PhoU [Thermoanaerobaculia bacterium]